MSWDIGVIRADRPPGGSIGDLAEVVPLGSVDEVDAVLAEIFPLWETDSPLLDESGYGCWVGEGFAVQIRRGGMFAPDGRCVPGQVGVVTFTPRGIRDPGVELVFRFAERFGAVVFTFSGCEVITRDTWWRHFDTYWQWFRRIGYYQPPQP